MKKWIVVCLITLLFTQLVSCQMLPGIDIKADETTTDIITSSNNAVFVVSHDTNSTMTETPTRLIYSIDSKLYYYNKITRESYIFCFDPLCEHDFYLGCISSKFSDSGDGLTSVQYCEHNNRFYALRGDKLCSFSFDGSDLKIEYSFGEEGDFDNFYYLTKMSNLSIWKNRVYFSRTDEELGTREIWYFNIDNQSVVNLTKNLQGSAGSILIQNDSLYFQYIDDTNSGIYRSDMDLKFMERIVNGRSSFGTNSVFHDDKVYYIDYESVEKDGAYTYVPKAIVCQDLAGSDVTDLYHIDDGVLPDLLAVTNSSIYFRKEDKKYFGYEIVRETMRVDKYNSYSKIYCLDIATGECEVVFDDMLCEVDELYFLSEKNVLILGEYCKGKEGDAWKYQKLFTAEIDETGNFINLSIQEVQK